MRLVVRVIVVAILLLLVIGLLLSVVQSSFTRLVERLQVLEAIRSLSTKESRRPVRDPTRLRGSDEKVAMSYVQRSDRRQLHVCTVTAVVRECAADQDVAEWRSLRSKQLLVVELVSESEASAWYGCYCQP